MATKRSRKAATPSGKGGSLLAEVERLFHSERFNDAVKLAKLGFSEVSTPANHAILERAYFLRAQQLAKLGMVTSAVEVALCLIDLGVTPSEWAPGFVRLLLSLGLVQQAIQIQEQLGLPDIKDELDAIVADQAVIHPERSLHVAPEITRSASLIRAALERIQLDDEPGALLLLKDLARSSPLSEWKFFIRGLSAHYRHDTGESKANWDRLDPKRKAFAIAQRLRHLAQPEAQKPDDKLFERMETIVFGEPVLARLRQANNLAAAQDWHKLLRLLGPLRHSLRRIDPALAERITYILFGPLIKEATTLGPGAAEHLLEDFIKAAEPMSIDPHWNRLFAIATDGPNADPDRSRRSWIAYIKDLNAITAFSESERALAQAMIWNHLAKNSLRQADRLDTNDESPLALPSFLRPEGSRKKGGHAKKLEDARKKVIDCLETSLQLAPAYLETHRLLVEVHSDRNDLAGVESAARRLLVHFPDDVETLIFLAHHFLDQNDYAAALPLVQRARVLKPLDESLRELESFIRIGLARKLALEARWDEGRDQFGAAEELCPDQSHDYTYLARKVIFEAKAGAADASNRFLRKAEATLVEPMPLWLALSIESIRFDMPKAAQDRYAELWNSDVKKKCRSETAGAIAALLDAFLGSGIDYPGRAGHVSQVADYLERASRLKYRREDIERVCEFLRRVPERAKLLEKRLAQGLMQHPKSAMLNLWSGLHELEKGRLPFASTKARKQLETALELAQQSNVPGENELLPTIKNALTLINEMSASPFGSSAFAGDGFPMPFPFPFPGGGSAAFGFTDAFDEYDEYDDGDDDSFGPSWFPMPMPLPRPARKPAKRKSRKKR